MGHPSRKFDNTQLKYNKEKWKNRPSIYLVGNKTKIIKTEQKKSKYFAYIVTADAGFAPNPFYRFCTLATCKPEIRKAAKVGDWIIGFYSRAQTVSSKKYRGKLIYAMKVTEKMNLDQYWKNEKFLKKKYSNKSSKSEYGDNIYHKNSKGVWVQEKNHYHYDERSKEVDIGGKFVLISNHFFYFGKNHVQLPKGFKRLVNKLPRGHKYKGLEKVGKKLIELLQKKYKTGMHGDPIDYTEDNVDCEMKNPRKINISRKGCKILIRSCS